MPSTTTRGKEQMTITPQEAIPYHVSLHYHTTPSCHASCKYSTKPSCCVSPQYHTRPSCCVSLQYNTRPSCCLPPVPHQTLMLYLPSVLYQTSILYLSSIAHLHVVFPLSTIPDCACPHCHNLSLCLPSVPTPHIQTMSLHSATPYLHARFPLHSISLPLSANTKHL